MGDEGSRELPKLG